ncbi:MAG TPA: serine hydrolase [Sphingomicrobium sp.]|jgi:CubicO group peptidase (beta-lactamase class C family)|nr:serine hydrolase [Sphingomicrobium sp.]
MLKETLRAVTAMTLALTASSALGAPPAGFVQRVEQLRKDFGVPGVSIAIVEDGKVTFAHGWGVRDISTNQPVDADTIFFTGSTGKAFTNAALATLVDEGKISWDDKVIDHMPDFRMWDPWVTREMTIRDLLVHRSGLGLGEGDLLFLPNSTLSRKETVRRIRYLKPATSFRSGYAYDNILYMAAGQLIEEVSGETWEHYIHAHVFAPLGMSHSTGTDAEFQADPNHARPHSRSSGAIHGLGAQTPLDENATIAQNAAPAGGLAISANDMSRWLLTQLGHGKIPGGDRRLFSEEQSEQMWTGVVITPIRHFPPEFAATEPNFNLYALGWDIEDYRGVKVVGHDGAVLGSQATIALLPGKNIGIFIAANSEDGEIILGLRDELLDYYLGQPINHWPEKFHKFKMDRLAAAAKQVQSTEAKPAAVGPSLPLDHYAGDYTDPWYGTIKVRHSGNGLTIDFPHSTGMGGELTHYQYDTFKTKPSLGWVEPAYVTFAIDENGKVDRVTMKPVSPAADFSWDYQDLLFTPAQGK